MPALDGIAAFERLEILYWLHLSRRDLVHQCARNDGVARGTFSLRTPVRPNPIGTHIVRLVSVDGANLFVRGLDCLDGTPLIDLKPDRTLFTPLAPRQPGDDQIEERTHGVAPGHEHRLTAGFRGYGCPTARRQVIRSGNKL